MQDPAGIINLYMRLNGATPSDLLYTLIIMPKGSWPCGDIAALSG